MQNEMLKTLIHADPILGKICQQIELPTIESTNDVFHDLISCIIEQQIHYRSTKRIFARALERAGIDHLTLDNFEVFEERGISPLKLAMSKVETLSAFYDYWQNNILDFNQLPDEEVRKELASIKGIGTWTIDMILLYTLKRPDIFPSDDFHLKQIMVSVYQLDPKVKLKSQMLSISKNWGNARSLAVLCLLEWKKRNKGL